MKKRPTPPNQASWVMRAVLVGGILFSTITRLSKGTTANAAGSKPIIWFGYVAETRRWMRKNCSGPLMAAVAQGTVLSANCRAKSSGKRAKTNKNNRYQINAGVAPAGSNHRRSEERRVGEECRSRGSA